MLEIGGGHGILSGLFLDRVPSGRWIIVDPDAQTSDSRVRVVRDYFPGSKLAHEKFDTVVHSHFLEHSHFPMETLRQIWSSLPDNGACVFSVPDMLTMLQRMQTNCITFEHTYLIDCDALRDAMMRVGLEITRKEKFADGHSIFYEVRKTDPIARHPARKSALSDLAAVYHDHHAQDAALIQRQIDEAPSEIFLFGAHVFSQSLLAFGVREDSITGVIDNNRLKHGGRLYGTSLRVFSPEVLRGKDRPKVVLRAGAYSDEIKRSLVEYCPSVIII